MEKTEPTFIVAAYRDQFILVAQNEELDARRCRHIKDRWHLHGVRPSKPVLVAVPWLGRYQIDLQEILKELEARGISYLESVT